ncbi:translation initiation factor IF-2-like [Hylaeus volcanicus]|uniref:translation initiation factor IF-2-like n=1 Tax=Hylaeus volcanicus TaxID=313075 RepID=UPI0023B7EC5F|nr:translation initiation factor IF-2-like [Hylaeus volcanicus]
MVRQLRIAAATIRHAAVEQAKRVKTSAREVELERTVAELRARVTELEARLARGPVAPAAVPPPVDPAVSVPVPPSRPSASSTARSSRPAASRPAPAGPSRKPAMGGATLAPGVDVEGLIRRPCGEMEVRLAARLGAVSLVAAASGAPQRVPRATPRPPAGPSQPGRSAVGSRPATDSGEPAKKKRGRKSSGKKQAGGAAAHPAPALPGRDRPRAAPAPAASRARPTPAPVAPSLTRPAPETWSKVLGRKERRAEAARSRTRGAWPAGAPAGPRVRPARVPKTAAVSLTVAPGSAMTYSEVMTKAVAGVRLRDVGVTGIRYRKGQTGSSILEIPGPDSAAGADRLAGRLAELFASTDVRVSRPIKSAEARVSGLDESVTADGVAAAVAAVTGCPVDRVQTGIIRRSGSGLGTVWLRCPAAAMRALLAAGRLLVDWSSARVEALPARALRCFRCLELGHVRQKCPLEADRGDRYYRCAGAGHRARECTAPMRCPVCADLGRPADHRLGAKKCAPPPPKQGRKARVTTPSSGESMPVNRPAADAPALAPAEALRARSPAAMEGGSGMEEAMDMA